MVVRVLDGVCCFFFFVLLNNSLFLIHDLQPDPIVEVEGKTYAEMGKEDKDKVSHRGRALEKLLAYLKEVEKKNTNKNADNSSSPSKKVKM